MPEPLIAIAPFVGSCPGVITLGVRACLGDYSASQRKLLASATRVLFPTARLARIFEAAGKTTFPSSLVYRIRKSNVLRETLLNFSGFPHPHTRIYFGGKKSLIINEFDFPFIAMGPRQELAVTVESPEQLGVLIDKYNPLIVQQKIEYEKMLHLVFVNYALAGLTRDPLPEGWGPTDCFPLFSDPALKLFITEVERFLRSFRLNDISAWIGFSRHDGWQIRSMKKPPVAFISCEGAPVNRYSHIAALIQEGKL